MEEMIIHGKVKRVGNSIAIFVTADERKKFSLSPDSDVELILKRKKFKDLFGILKGTKLTSFTEEDRADFHG